MDNVSDDRGPYRQALAFLYDRLNYERTVQMPYRKAELKLERMVRLLQLLGDPQRGQKIVHVAGTKGKGSTCAMLSSILQQAGYRTGLYTSPHLLRVEERVAIDGQPCSADELVALVDALRPAVERLERQAAAGDGQGPTFFELTTALALLHFARRQVEYTILEVGLGGRLDSTNVCRPQVAVITSISYDHTSQLGTHTGSHCRREGRHHQAGRARDQRRDDTRSPGSDLAGRRTRSAVRCTTWVVTSRWTTEPRPVATRRRVSHR